MTRKMLISLIMQAFVPLNRTIGPFVMKKKITNCLVCQAVPLLDQTKPISEFDAVLTSRPAVACNQLALLGQAKSWPCVLLRTSERFSHLVVPKDWSLSG